MTAPDGNWRATQADPCTCKPGTEGCPREQECLDAFYAYWQVKT